MKEISAYTPYTYCILFKPTGQQYYGVQTRKDAHPNNLLVNYFTSSKVVKDLISKHGLECFEIISTEVHATKEVARAIEENFLVNVDAGRSEHWLNRSNGPMNFCPTMESEKKRVSTLAANPEIIKKISEKRQATISSNPEIRKQMVASYKSTLARNPDITKQKVASFKATFAKNPEIMKQSIAKCKDTLAKNPDIRKQADAKRLITFAKNPEIMKQMEIKRQATHAANPEIRKQEAEKKAKSYTIVFPDGIVKVIKNLKQFCRENKLDDGNMRKVAKGKSLKHKGFKCSYYS